MGIKGHYQLKSTNKQTNNESVMQLTYSLDSTTIVATKQELDSNHSQISKARKSEERKGRTVTVLIRLEIHAARDKQIKLAPAARLFPRPVCSMGAIVPVIVADKLRQYAKDREQPLSDLTRVLWTEFLIAKKRGDSSDSWTSFIEEQLDDILSLRQAKKKISYARTRQVKVRTDYKSRKNSRKVKR